VGQFRLADGPVLLGGGKLGPQMFPPLARTNEPRISTGRHRIAVLGCRRHRPLRRQNELEKKGPDGCNGTSKQGIPPRNNRWLAKTHDATAYLGALIRSKRRMLPQSRPN
jgi:hypothetical protein